MIDQATLLAQIDELEKIPTSEHYASTVHILQRTVTLCRAVYGDGSPQLNSLVLAEKKVRDMKEGLPTQNYRMHVLPIVLGTLQALRGDISGGMIGNVFRRGAGETLADLLSLATETLDASRRDENTNVAAVLVAAAFEDTLRRMGDTFAGIHDRRDLSLVVQALRNSQHLKGAAGTTAQGLLTFRNDALHADWPKLTRATVETCKTFVAQVLAEHFS